MVHICKLVVRLARISLWLCNSKDMARRITICFCCFWYSDLVCSVFHIFGMYVWHKVIRLLKCERNTLSSFISSNVSTINAGPRGHGIIKHRAEKKILKSQLRSNHTPRLQCRFPSLPNNLLPQSFPLPITLIIHLPSMSSPHSR